jgi:hypothetical protein
MGDFNNDHLSDFVVTNSGNDSVGVYLGFGNGSISAPTTFPTGNRPNGIALGDFNGDTENRSCCRQL